MSQFSDSKSLRTKSAGEREQTYRDVLLAEIEKGEEAIKEGRMLSHEEARERMSRWLRDNH